MRYYKATIKKKGGAPDQIIENKSTRQEKQT